MLRFRGCQHEWFHGAYVTYWPRRDGVSLGMFVFVPEESRGTWRERLRYHEYGHTIQSLILGPLYLPTVGLTSAIWANARRAQDYRVRTSRGYYEFWCEKWADRLGKRFM